jgi:uncharacterized protein YtpQ (UPF0354 family)
MLSKINLNKLYLQSNQGIDVEKLLNESINLLLDRKKRKFQLNLNGEIVEQNTCEFLHTISFLVGKDIEEYLLSTDSAYDSVRIPLTGTGKTVTLTLSEFIAFREAYNQQMFMLKLEDLLLRKGISIP